MERIGTTENKITGNMAVYFKAHHMTIKRIEEDIVDSLFYSAFKYCDLVRTAPSTYKLTGPADCVISLLKFFR